MKVRYLNYRIDGVEMTGKVVEKPEDEARILISSNIVVPVEGNEIETATKEPRENAMIKKPKRR